MLKSFTGVNRMKKSVLLELVASQLSDSENKAFKGLMEIFTSDKCHLLKEIRAALCQLYGLNIDEFKLNAEEFLQIVCWLDCPCL